MNKYNPAIHHRRSIRLKGYDYSQAGAYFITICCQDRACLFGEITNDELKLNDAGKMIEDQWLALAIRFTNVELHECIVMPNHFHGILRIVDNVGVTLVVAQNLGIAQHDDGQPQHDDGQPQGFAPTGTSDVKNKTVGDMMDAFKSITTVEYIRGVKNMDWQSFNGKLWQRNYYEHIIRNDQAYQTISNYIINNPSKWNDDKFYQ